MNASSRNERAERLLARLQSREAVAGVIGLGYVGLPLAVAAAKAGFSTVGFDIDAAKKDRLERAQSYIDAVADEDLRALIDAGRLDPTTDFTRIGECDVVVICVPTPLDRHREPDMRYVISTAETIVAALRPGQLVILESTTYPGTTTELLVPVLERSGLSADADFFVGFSPEREDPGNTNFSTVNTPKVVSGTDGHALALVEAFYGAFIAELVPVSSTAAAEAVKITENIFRAVNIALVNELKTVFDALDIDIWEVVDAAKTKPFGYMPFYPGPGLGGHCIPIDPYYLAWRARSEDIPTRFIELAGEVNRSMPAYVVARLERALDSRFSKSLGSARVLIIGLAYKRNVGDVRESPAFKIMELLAARGTQFAYHDPHVAAVPQTRDYGQFEGLVSTALDPATVADHDAVLILTDHDAVDYALLAEHAPLIVDTRNAMRSRKLGGAVELA
ncbi:nucleotide sugar dehydrogenase [Oricola sp.]|uniref:nucleotide sugar dehydrogenase n=1 Tax=Oricola sp. TaxID=1979950 RepID=UPI003BA9D78E